MKDPQILLLDFNPEGTTSRTLRDTLAPFSRLTAHLAHVTIESSDGAYPERTLSAKISPFIPDLVLLILPPMLLEQASTLFKFFSAELSVAPILAITEWSTAEDIAALFKSGISDYVTLPFTSVDLIPRIWRLLERAFKDTTLSHTIKERLGLKQVIGESTAFVTEINKIPAIAGTDVGVLIMGETGTGKEVCARAIHYLSRRAKQPFVPVNCAAIPLDLVENELFGHDRGAFTGAFTSKAGLIHEASGGTLFLDEIDCLPLLAQVKLLRFIQEKEYRPLGSTKRREVDVRIIAATNVNLEQVVRKGLFRQDLYYRLNVIPMTLPPLRERGEDIPLLANHFLSKYALKFRRRVITLSPDAIQALLCHDWPGNVRELEHVIERAVVLCSHDTIRSADLFRLNPESTAHADSLLEAKNKIVAQFERAYIYGLLMTHHGNVTRAAHAAQKNRRAFWHLIQKYNFDMQDFRGNNK